MPESPPTDPAAPTDPDGQALYDALTEAGTSHPVAYNAVGGVRNMSGQTIAAEIRAQNAKFDTSTARFESKLDAQNAKFDAQNAKFDAQNTKFDELRRENSTLRWMLGLGFTVLGILIAILALVLK